MFEILLGTLIFTGLVMVLALVVLGARALVWGQGHAKLTVNGERVIECALGEKLLGALEQGGVHLPTSCGGAGTCGLCRVCVTQGAQDSAALPVERAKINACELGKGFRLACQVVVRGDMDITVPHALLGAASWTCVVRETHNLSPLIKEIVLSLPPDAPRHFSAGSYILVNAPAFALSFTDITINPDFEPAWRRMGLRALHIENHVAQTRAYSLVARPDADDVLVLNIRLALPPGVEPGAPPGVVSSYLFGLDAGARVDVSGPYGDFFVRETGREMVFIGGGVGMAPLASHVFDQLERAHTSRTISYWYGARSRIDLYYTEEMSALAKTHDNFSWHPALSEPAPEDNWQGAHGFIHDVVYRNYLQGHPNPERCDYYLCGPPLMISAVRAMLAKLDVPDDQIFSDDFGV